RRDDRRLGGFRLRHDGRTDEPALLRARVVRLRRVRARVRDPWRLAVHVLVLPGGAVRRLVQRGRPAGLLDGGLLRAALDLPVLTAPLTPTSGARARGRRGARGRRARGPRDRAARRGDRRAGGGCAGGG